MKTLFEPFESRSRRDTIVEAVKITNRNIVAIGEEIDVEVITHNPDWRVLKIEQPGTRNWAHAREGFWLVRGDDGMIRVFPDIIFQRYFKPYISKAV